MLEAPLTLQGVIQWSYNEGRDTLFSHVVRYVAYSELRWPEDDECQLKWPRPPTTT